jgi:hypothetical protein
MSLENQGIFWRLKKIFVHCFTAFVCGSFVRHSSAYSGLPQVS